MKKSDPNRGRTCNLLLSLPTTVFTAIRKPFLKKICFFKIVFVSLWSGLSLYPQHYLVEYLTYSLCIELIMKLTQLTINMVINKCNHCGKETANPKFCSKSCSAKETNKKPKRKLTKKCTQCDSVVRNYRSKLCEHHYQKKLTSQKDHLQNLTLQDYTERSCIKRLHPSSKFAHIRGLCRSWNKNKLKLPCHVCGYTKHVELAHIKPLSSFSFSAQLKEVNSPSNVVQLCPNCHWELDNGLITLAFPDQSEST